MLVINKLKFAANENEFMESLFKKGDGTCYGYYKVARRKNAVCVKLFDMRKELFAAVVDNGDFCGIVNARLHGKREFFQFAASEKTENLLGVPKGYLASIDYAKSILAELN